MNWLDFMILAVVGVSTFMGLKIGVIRAALIATGLFVGGVLGGQLSDDIGGVLSEVDPISWTGLVQN